MENCIVFMTLLVSILVANTVNCIMCPEIPLTVPDMQCFCSPKEAQGWEKSCYMKPTLNELNMLESNLYYSLTYTQPKNVLNLNCNSNKNINYTTELYEGVSETTAIGFKFTNCPLPDKPVKEILRFFHVMKLQLSSVNINSPIALNSSFLSGLSELTDLYFSGGIQSVSEDFLSNLSKLTTLRMVENNMATLPKELFSPTKELIHLSLDKNNLLSLPETLFHGLSKLTRLYLHRNRLSTLPAKLFKGMKALTILELRGNLLVQMPSEIFSDLPSLKKLSISGNKLKTLPSGIFENNTNLETLNFNANQFADLPENLLFGLNNLRAISMLDCNMTDIPEGFFSRAKNLETIILRNNRIKSIPPSFFSQNAKLKTINLIRNDLQNLTYDMLKGLYNLKMLDVSGNKIQYISSDAFQDTYQLEKLIMISNRISTLDNKVFYKLTQLKKLDLSRNKLNFQNAPHHFSNLIQLEQLNLRYNNLTKIPIVNNLVSLKLVDLRNNRITDISPVTDVSKGAKYLLGYNTIRKINMLFINGVLTIDKIENPVPSHRSGINFFEVQPIYDLGPNLIDCDCNFYDFLIYLRKYGNKRHIPVRFATSRLTCQSPHSMHNKRLAQVNIQQLKCEITDQCPNYCSCKYNPFLKTNEAKCGLGLQAMPKRLPDSTSIFQIENASMTADSLAGLSNVVYQNISDLSLSHNLISKLPFTYLPLKLELLDISFNKFEIMPTWIPLYTKNHNTRYRLGNNSWVCNCSAIDFKRWLVKNHKNVLDIKNVVCNGSKSAHGTLGKLVYEINDSTLCPNNSTIDISDMSTYIVITLTLISFVALGIFLCVYKKYQIKFFFFRHNIFMFLFKDDDDTEGKKFDAFISYSYLDSDFVTNELVPELELTEPKYNLCIHERNFVPGTAISENIINATALSRRTVVILSNNYLQSEWGILEFKCAYQKMLEGHGNQMIIILLDEINEKNFTETHKDLQLCLTTKTYLKRDQTHFWAKLRHVLPKQPLPKQSDTENGPVLVLPDYKQQQKLRPKVKEVNNEINEKMKLKLSEFEMVDKNNSCNAKKSEGIPNPSFKKEIQPKCADTTMKIMPEKSQWPVINT